MRLREYATVSGPRREQPRDTEHEKTGASAAFGHGCHGTGRHGRSIDDGGRAVAGLRSWSGRTERGGKMAEVAVMPTVLIAMALVPAVLEMAIGMSMPVAGAIEANGPWMPGEKAGELVPLVIRKGGRSDEASSECDDQSVHWGVWISGRSLNSAPARTADV